MLISLNVSTGIFQVAATTVQYLKSQLTENKTTDQFSIISSPVYTWLFKYPFEINNTINYRDEVNIKTPNIILVIDGSFGVLSNPYKKDLHLTNQYLMIIIQKVDLLEDILGTWIKIDLGVKKRSAV